MKNKLIYACKKCGHIEIEKITWKLRIWRIVKLVCSLLIIPLLIIGFLSLYFSISAIIEYPKAILTTGIFRISIGNFMNSFQSSGEINKIALNLTKGCNNDECKAKKIYEHLKPFKSDAGAERMNPLEIWESGYGDCDELIALYMALLKELNIKSKMICNNNHCWSIVLLKEKSILVDITSKKWEEK